jgi:hypothetical protein
MNQSFHIKFVIFDENKDLTTKQKTIRMQLVNVDMRKILEYAISELNEYKLLDKAEPTISSIDEKKQLRLKLVCGTPITAKQHSLIFRQNYSHDFFTIEEIKIVSRNIKSEIEEYLHHEIDTIIFTEIDDI